MKTHTIAPGYVYKLRARSPAWKHTNTRIYRRRGSPAWKHTPTHAASSLVDLLI